MKLLSRPAPVSDQAAAQRGQILIIFAGGMILFMLLMALILDVGWYWSSQLKMQRAADAAALAGAVYLPGDYPDANKAALAIAKMNGYVPDANTTISTAVDPSNSRQLNVSISGKVSTFFLRVIGMQNLSASKSAKAVFVLPVPMGSPLNVFGQPTSHDAQGNDLNFWGAISGPNTDKANGDPFATRVDSTNDSSVTNAEYKTPTTGEAGPYDYAIETTSANTNLVVSIYDPAFCDRGDLNTDTGDYTWHNGDKLDTTFTLYKPSLTPYDYADDSSVATHTYTTAADCGSGSKNSWVTFTTIASPQIGVYRLNVSTKGSDSSPNSGNLTNQFALQATVSSGTAPKVYGLGAMSIFANMNTGTTNLYLAQIAALHAGKTMEIRLFDPGDANGNASMQFLMPTSSGWSATNFTYYDAGADGTLNPGASALTSTLTTTSNGGATTPFNGHWVVIDISIPSTYTAPQSGWWKAAYTYSGGAAHDRTTWQVNIRGNPVRLLVP